jgi:predicted site-specific integrase-resolvase
MNEPFRLNLKDGDLDYLKTTQVCKKYNISNKTLDRWKKDGLKYYKMGRSKTSMITFKTEHIEDFMEKHLVVV